MTEIVRRPPLISNGVLGILMFIAMEVMFFAALISAYLVLRMGAVEWPPWGQPRLPVSTTALNTVILLLSGGLLIPAKKAFDAQNIQKTAQWILCSILLGALFIAFQGYEWVGLLQYGLTMVSSTYGSLFYLIVGAHGLHALIGLMVLANPLYQIYTSQAVTSESFLVARLYWYFVVLLWPILYYCVYIL